jgi:hypothetical protein
MTEAQVAVRAGEKILDQFLGDAAFPVEWQSDR